MAKITKPDLKALRLDLNELLGAYNKNSDFTLKLGNCSFGDSEATFQLKLTADGEMTREQKNVELFTDFKFGDKLSICGKVYTIKGYVPRRPKKPVQIEDEQGRGYKCGDEHLKHASLI